MYNIGSILDICSFYEHLDGGGANHDINDDC